MLYQQGCNKGGTILCDSKDLVENTKDTSVLIVCLEITIDDFHYPNETDVNVL